jgi:hypothetical protein
VGLGANVGIRSPTVQTVASRYTDYAVLEVKATGLHILVSAFLDSDGKTIRILNYECVCVCVCVCVCGNIGLLLHVSWDGSASTVVETRAHLK